MCNALLDQRAKTEQMKPHVLVKVCDVALKGNNRPWLMRRLVDNLRLATQGIGVEDIRQHRMMIRLSLSDEAQWPEIRQRVKDCFGVAKFYRAYDLPRDLQLLKHKLPALLENHLFNSFRISTHRADKQFPLTSVAVNRDLGAFVNKLVGARVDLTNPDLCIYLDIQPKNFFLYFEEVKGHGGLPAGTSGRVAVMLSGGIDSPVAAWQMMKRGCRAQFVHFHSHPLVDRTSMEKAADLVQHLTRHQHRADLFLVPLAEIQRNVILSVPASYRVIMYRRFMVRITEVLARRSGAKAIVTGDSCGQVSSQTLDNIAVVEQVAGMPILRPFIGMNKEEIVKIAREVGTFPISILIMTAVNCLCPSIQRSMQIWRQCSILRSHFRWRTWFERL